MRRPNPIRFSLLMALTFLLAPATMAWGQATDAPEVTEGVSAGQQDLDDATALKLGAESMADLERVIELCESAMEKGLDDESEKLAKSLITATLFQHGSRFAQALFDPRERTQRPSMLKQFALRDLYKVLKYDDSLPQVHMMIARLEGVNTGSRGQQEGFEKGRTAADRAIELLDEDLEMKSKALVLRAGYATRDERLGFLDDAIKADPKNSDAWRLRGKSRLVDGEILAAAGKLEEARKVREQAIDDFTKLLEENPEDPDALQAVAELMGRLGNFEEAIEHANRALERNPRATSLYILRGRLYHELKEYDKSIEDFDRAIDLQPDSFIAFLDRSEVYYDKGDKASAAKDYGLARELQGIGITQAVLQRISVRAEGEFDNAITDMKRFAELDELNAEADGRDPDPDYLLQLGQTYLATNKNNQSIEVLTTIIDRVGEEPRDRRARNAKFLGLRTRADAFLGLGKHNEAIGDYDKALKINSTEDGVLNNLAWVLATSPKDDLRNADRAIELATKACKVTEYKEAHILSTLAAAYAESGDFDKAMEWSSKAVELGANSTTPETLEQLRNELNSYKQKKPWRELQDVSNDAEDAVATEGAAEGTEESADEQSSDDKEPAAANS